MWECQPRAHAVLLRPSQLPAVIAIVAFTFLAGFVWVSSPRGSGEGWISVLLLAYPAVGVRGCSELDPFSAAPHPLATVVGTVSTCMHAPARAAETTTTCSVLLSCCAVLQHASEMQSGTVC